MSENVRHLSSTLQPQACRDLIDWNKDSIYEPIFSCSLNRNEVRDIVETPLQVDYFPLHTQSTERAVKLVRTQETTQVCRTGPTNIEQHQANRTLIHVRANCELSGQDSHSCLCLLSMTPAPLWPTKMPISKGC